MVGFFVILFIIVAIIGAIKPKIGVWAIWFVTWLYPIGLLHAILPLNIRFDDIYLLWITLVVFAGSMGKYDIRSRVVILAILWFLCIAMGLFVGVVTGPSGIWFDVVRHLGKRLYIPLIAYAVWKTARTEEDIKGHVIAIVLAGFAAAIIGIMQVKAPHLVRMWEIPGYLYYGYMKEAFAEILRRAGGALGTMYFAVTTMSLLLLTIRFLVRRCGTKLRILSVFSMPLFGVGLIFSGTRGAIGGAVLGVFYMLIRQRKRFILLFVSAVFVVYLLFGTNLPERVLERFGGRQTTVRGGLKMRFEIWGYYLAKFSPHYFLFGRSFVGEHARVGFTAHSSYVGAIAYTGLIGTIVTTLFLFHIWNYARKLRRYTENMFSMALAEGIVAILIATLFSGLFIEILQGHQMRLIAAMGVLAERYVWLQSQAEAGGQGYAEMDSYITEDAAAAAIAKTGYEYNWGT